MTLARINASIEVYPEAHHGFAFHTRKSVYHKVACERHWERLIALYLGGSGSASGLFNADNLIA